MYMDKQLITLALDYDQAIEHVVLLLTDAGFRVIRSFDYRGTRAAQAECACPHHGTDECDCQFVVLLVYGSASPPVSIQTHGRDGQTQFVLIQDPHQLAEPALEIGILRALGIDQTGSSFQNSLPLPA